MRLATRRQGCRSRAMRWWTSRSHGRERLASGASAPVVKGGRHSGALSRSVPLWPMDDVSLKYQLLLVVVFAIVLASDLGFLFRGEVGILKHPCYWSDHLVNRAFPLWRVLFRVAPFVLGNFLVHAV